MNDLMLTTLALHRRHELRQAAQQRQDVRQALVLRAQEPSPAPTAARRHGPARRTPVATTTCACACSA